MPCPKRIYFVWSKALVFVFSQYLKSFLFKKQHLYIFATNPYHMKKYLFLLLAAFVFSSCEKAELTTYDITIQAQYQVFDWTLGKTLTWADKGAIVYIFYNLDKDEKGLEFDGMGNMSNATQVLKYSQTLTLDELGLAYVKLKKGVHTIAVISNNLKRNGQKAIITSSIKFDGSLDNEEASFIFKEY